MILNINFNNHSFKSKTDPKYWNFQIYLFAKIKILMPTLKNMEIEDLHSFNFPD